MHTQTRTGTHTREIKRRLAAGTLKDLACAPKLKLKAHRAAEICGFTDGMSITSASLHLNSRVIGGNELKVITMSRQVEALTPDFTQQWNVDVKSRKNTQPHITMNIFIYCKILRYEVHLQRGATKHHTMIEHKKRKCFQVARVLGDIIKCHVLAAKQSQPQRF